MGLIDIIKEKIEMRKAEAIMAAWALEDFYARTNINTFYKNYNGEA